MSFWSKHERMTGLFMHLHLFAYFLVLSSFLKKEEQWRVLLSIAVGIAADLIQDQELASQLVEEAAAVNSGWEGS